MNPMMKLFAKMIVKVILLSIFIYVLPRTAKGSKCSGDLSRNAYFVYFAPFVVFTIVSTIVIPIKMLCI